MDSYWIAIASGFISLATLIYGVASGKKKASGTYVETLERRLEMAEEALERCRKSEEEQRKLIAAIQEENVNLMRMIVALKKGE